MQDQVKAKLAYDVSPMVRATYTVGWWNNTSEGCPTSYLRNAAGNTVYSGTIHTGGRSYTLLPTDFNQSNEKLEHVLSGLTVKSRTQGAFDWELAASMYDYRQDELRVPTVALKWAAMAGIDNLNNYPYRVFHPYSQRAYFAQPKFDL